MSPRILLLALSLLGSAGVRAAESEAPVAFDPAKPDAVWKPIVTAIAKVRPIEAKFVENRYLTFRRLPVTVPGVMRYRPGTGVSLAHGDEAVLVKSDGLYRKSGDKFEKIPYDGPAVRAPRLMMSVVGFDPAAVARDFVTEGRVSGAEWSMRLTPRDAAMVKAVSKLEVKGSGDRLTHIAVFDGDRVRLEIFIHAVAFPDKFSPADERAWFGL